MKARTCGMVAVTVGLTHSRSGIGSAPFAIVQPVSVEESQHVGRTSFRKVEDPKLSQYGCGVRSDRELRYIRELSCDGDDQVDSDGCLEERDPTRHISIDAVTNGRRLTSYHRIVSGYSSCLLASATVSRGTPRTTDYRVQNTDSPT